MIKKAYEKLVWWSIVIYVKWMFFRDDLWVRVKNLFDPWGSDES